MPTKLEKSLYDDIEAIRQKVVEMGELAEEALRASFQALEEKNRKIAYSVVLRDRYIDEHEKQLDRLCQEFLVRQQPAGGHLRFVYAVIKINNELERIGDYAESIARQFMTLTDLEEAPAYDRFSEIADFTFPMLLNAMKAFNDQDPELAKATMQLERQVDALRYDIDRDLMRLHDKDEISSKALIPMMIISSRFERAADQACNICEEVLFMCTGEDIKHEGKEVFRILFVDEGDSCRGQMAEGIGRSLGLRRFMFSSAGVAPRPIDPRTVQFMKQKGIDISGQTSKYLNQTLNLGSYQAIVSLCEEAEEAFPPPPTKTVTIRWQIDDPSKVKGAEEEIIAAYEKTYNYINGNIHDLVEAILGEEITTEEA